LEKIIQKLGERERERERERVRERKKEETSKARRILGKTQGSDT
jgi:hypothetical protein